MVKQVEAQIQELAGAPQTLQSEKRKFAQQVVSIFTRIQAQAYRDLRREQPSGLSSGWNSNVKAIFPEGATTLHTFENASGEITEHVVK